MATDNSGDIDAVLYFNEMLGYSANSDYARQQADVPLKSFTDDNGRFYNNSWAGGKSYNQLLRKAWDNICPWGTCASFVFESYSDDTTYTYLGLNKYHVQLADFSNQSFYDPNYNITKGQKHKLTMCADTISQTKAMSILGRYPPVQLIQTYFECRPLLQTAVVTSVGNAVGAANLAISVGTIVVGFLLVFGTNV